MLRGVENEPFLLWKSPSLRSTVKGRHRSGGRADSGTTTPAKLLQHLQLQVTELCRGTAQVAWRHRISVASPYLHALNHFNVALRELCKIPGFTGRAHSVLLTDP